MTFAQLAEKNLSNNFKGKEKMSRTISALSATANKYRVDISNTSQQAVNIAITPGHYRVLGAGAATGTEPVPLHYRDLTEIQKSQPMVTAVLDDGTQAVTGGAITCTPSDPSFSIRSFLEYIRFNPMVLSMIRIRAVSGSTVVFSNNLKLSKTNPFNRTEEIPISTEQFFQTTQYQDSMIDIDMLETGLVVGLDLMMILTIPAQSTVGFDMFFAN